MATPPQSGSIDQVGRWKPFPEVYLHAAARLGVPPNVLPMVAVQAWDIHGAKQAGLLTGWADRLEGRWNGVTGTSLVEIVHGLLG